jgi:hypothetical protein
MIGIYSIFRTNLDFIMEQEYTTHIGWKIVYGLLTMLLFGFIAFITIAGRKDMAPTPGVLVMIALEIGGASLVFINLYKRKIVLSDKEIRYTSVWGSNEILFNNIKGYRITKGGILIFPIERRYPRIYIRDYSSIGNNSEFTEWLRENYNDVDRVKFEQEKQEIIASPNLGATPEVREAKYELAVKLSIGYNTIGVVLFMAFTMLSVDNVFLNGFMLLYPLIGIGLVIYTKGLIRIVARLDSSAYRSIYIGTLVPITSLIAKALKNITLFDDNDIVWPVLIVGSIVFIIFLTVIIIWARPAVLSQFIFIILFSVSYAFGSVLEVNYAFDNSKEQVFSVPVIGHNITHDKSDSYSLLLGTWGNYHMPINLYVSDIYYNDKPVGSTVKVHLKQGFLYIPWFTITKN